MSASIDWNSIDPSISGEAWLAVHEGKARTKEHALRVSRVVTTEESKQFDGYLHPLSLDSEAGEESTVFAKLENGDFDAGWQKRCGIGAFADDENELTDEELTNKQRQQVSPCLRDIFEKMGASIRSALSASTSGLGIKKSSSNKLIRNCEKAIQQAHSEGKSKNEIITMVEQTLGKYFPEILARHEARMQIGVERKESARVLYRDMKTAQRELF